MREVRLSASNALAVAIGSALLACAARAEPVEAIEEIVVSARKQVENLQDVPIAVSVLSGADLEALLATGLNDLAMHIPGLVYGNFGDLKLSPTSLRGIVGSSGSASADPAVGLYVDEVYLGQGAGAPLDLFDIERVEVLRGPQGTLYGRNTIGGVINVVTRRPSTTPGADVELQYGNYDEVRAGISLTGPLGTDSVAGKLTAIYDDRSGTTDDEWVGRDTNTQHHWTARGQVLFAPSDDTAITLTGEYWETDQKPLAFETLRYNDAATLPQVLDLFGLPRNTDPYDRRIWTDSRNVEKLELKGVSANLRSSLGGMGVSAILSYRTHDYENRSDTDRSPARFIYDGDPEQLDRVSAEFRLDGASGALSWLAGVFYYNQDGTNESFIEVGADLADLLGAPSAAGLRAGSDARVETDSYAAFGSLTWTFADHLDATFGGRYTYEKKSIDYVQSDPVGLLGGDFAVAADDQWSEFTPSASLRYRYDDSRMVYATVSKGFKSGGFNDALGDADGIAFDPETLWNYELGYKAELLGRRLVANLAVYYMDWADIQITNDNPATPVFDPVILNAGAAHSTGVELELNASISERFEAFANFALQDAKYDEGTLPGGEALDAIPFAPRYTADLGGEYRVPLERGELKFGADVVLRGESYLDLINSPDGKVRPYQMFNARVGYAAPDDRWSVTLWGKNLSDETVKQRLFDLTDQDVIGQSFVALNDPRTYGITVRYGF